MIKDGYYGLFNVSKTIFDSVSIEMCISGTNESVKYLCANNAETEHLISLGLEAIQNCDWYKVEMK